MCASAESFTDGGSGGPVSLNDGRVGGLVWVGWLDLFIHPREYFISPVSTVLSADKRRSATVPTLMPFARRCVKARLLGQSVRDDRVHYAN